MTPKIVSVERIAEGAFIHVKPVWADVDKPSAIGWLVKPELAPRLERALLAGVICTNPSVQRDAEGKTYVYFYCSVAPRTMSADLKKLGF